MVGGGRRPAGKTPSLFHRGGALLGGLLGVTRSKVTHRRYPLPTAPNNAPPASPPGHLAPADLPRENQLVAEAALVAYGFQTLLLQLLNLYRTVWWLPHSYTRFAMNLHLIDPRLVLLVVLILGRRFVLHLASQIALSFWPHLSHGPGLTALRASITAILGVIYLTLAAPMLQDSQHPMLRLFYLCYPVCVYLVVFGASGQIKPPDQLHCCQVAARYGADGVRRQVDRLKHDFNMRLKDALFDSVLSAYYAGFIPCAFAPNALHYDAGFATQHLAFAFGGALALRLTHCFPPAYCQDMHRWAVHLSAWPGNPDHSRFCRAFGAPLDPEESDSGSGAWVQLLAALFQAVVVGGQLTYLVQSSDWNHILCLSLPLFMNYYSLYKLIRDYFLISKINGIEAKLMMAAAVRNAAEQGQNAPGAAPEPNRARL